MEMSQRRWGTRCPVKSPCMNCLDREIGCHGKCLKYKEFQSKISAVRSRERAYNTCRRMVENE